MRYAPTMRIARTNGSHAAAGRIHMTVTITRARHVLKKLATVPDPMSCRTSGGLAVASEITPVIITTLAKSAEIALANAAVHPVGPSGSLVPRIARNRMIPRLVLNARLA